MFVVRVASAHALHSASGFVNRFALCSLACLLALAVFAVPGARAGQQEGTAASVEAAGDPVAPLPDKDGFVHELLSRFQVLADVSGLIPSTAVDADETMELIVQRYERGDVQAVLNLRGVTYEKDPAAVQELSREVVRSMLEILQKGQGDQTGADVHAVCWVHQARRTDGVAVFQPVGKAEHDARAKTIHWNEYQED
ncbi:MAG: hypothetical protein AB7D47_00655 [Desulfovibrio sp.]|jgi:hypothetical protein